MDKRKKDTEDRIKRKGTKIQWLMDQILYNSDSRRKNK